MAIRKPSELNFDDKTFTMIISGSPGIGKTTLALSAPEPLLFDLDKGISRVSAKHRKIASEADTYEEMLADMESAEYKAAKTIVLDTGGSLVQLMQPWAKKQEPKAARDGRAMFGVIKREFDRLTHQIRSIDKKNCIIIFHTTEVAKGDVITQRLSCEGSAKDIVWTPADLGCYMYIMGNRRMLGFSPTEEYFAKSCYGIKGLLEVPSLDNGAENDYLTRLFAQAKVNLAAEMEQYGDKRAKYDEAMDEASGMLMNVENADDLNAAMAQLMAMEHALTSKQEIKKMIVAKSKELKLQFNKEAGKYVPTDTQSA